MRTLINLHCKHCGNKYERRVGKEARSKYCSRRCHALDLIAGRDNYPKWIKVSDRLPEPYQFVLVYAITGTSEPSALSIAQQSLDSQEKYVWELLDYENKSAIAAGESWDICIEKITHWMPLPKPPEELRKKE